MGFVNADALRVQGNGVERLSRYITKYPERADDVEDEPELRDLHRRTRGQRRWHQSKNLVIPYATYADAKYKQRDFDAMLKNFKNKDFWEQIYREHTFISCIREKSEISGWTICLKMQRRDVMLC